ncbi:hypothetical protein M409DRAFT_51613 [Zasmidium cellare ATCC 36951]|uniref:Heterokaryon incompatibility domain-containing protein n=1 Tax=Zasmidium cellare ATCC 36951 TaxID=1080233 RepID=A0A6A6CXL2_ZASCE|nr:uncharacterized protein M409DRAFT_51613 [Zasmidium cellare ATCC 36951]KAF2170602.1 hypothetical protein M409DRAFT_51613 [Zasmidium cellare ATCC 36951]
MDIIYDVRAQDAFRIAKAATKTARFGGNMFKRILSTSFNGLCQTCNNLQPFNHERTFGQPEVPWENRPWAHREELIKIPTLVLEHIPAKDILASRQVDPQTGKVKKDCAYCRLLCEVFDHFFGFVTDKWDHHVISGLSLSVGLMIKQGQPLVIQCWNFEWDASVSTSRVDLELYLDSDLPANATDAPTTTASGWRAADSSSPSCMTFIRECIDQCWHQHPRCRNSSSSNFTPTRLIYIGDTSDDIRLFEAASTGLAFQWAALSHCWGGGDPFALKTGNMNTLLADIPIDELPATFKDAISVCRNLGIQYLWIDSLCIIQDDGQDWEREAAQMGMVYSEALVVISGGSSKNPDTPFLGPRDEDWIPQKFDFLTPKTGSRVPVTVRRRYASAAPLEQGLHQPPYTSFWSHSYQKGPLYKRAWCFQESHLPTRNIHFSHGSIIFECQTHRRSEDQLAPYPQLYSNVLGQVDDGAKWRMIVQQYTSRQLTYASDKLPAISGVASLMPQASRTRYIAGLWEESLVLDLMWQANPAPKEVLAYPPDELTAPSWSWACLNRKVVHNPFKSFTPLATVISAESTPKSATAPFGAITHASITLRARMRPCRIRWKADKYSHRAYYVEPNGTLSEEKHLVSDGLLTARYPEAPEGSRYVCRARGGLPYEGEMDAAFVCLADTGLSSYSFVGLLVTPSVKVEGAWERVASLTNLRRKWWEGGDEVEVLLV